MMRALLMTVALVVVMLAGCAEETELDSTSALEAIENETPAVEPVAKPELKPEPTPPVEPKPEPAPVVKPKPVKPPKPEIPAAVEDKVAVTVNGQKIMLSAVNKRIEPQLARTKKMERKPTEEDLNNFRQRVMPGLVRETLLDAKKKANNIVVTDADVNAKLEEIAKQQGQTVAELIASAAPRGYTEEKIREQIIKPGLGFEKLMDIEAGEGKLAVTEEEAKKFYDENSASFSSPDLVRTSHILTGGRGFDKFDDAKKKEAKLKIEEAKKKLDAGGNFEELAKEYSVCPSKNDPTPGNLKFYIGADGKYIDETTGRPGRMDPIFSAAAHKLEVGGVTDIVETPFGYHIIKSTDKKAAKVTTFEEAKADIIAQQAQMKKSQFASTYIKKLMDTAEIVYAEGFEPKVQPRPRMKPPAPKN